MRCGNDDRGGGGGWVYDVGAAYSPKEMEPPETFFLDMCGRIV